MTASEAINYLKSSGMTDKQINEIIVAFEVKTLELQHMMYDIYMAGVNMTGEYQGCWVRFRDIENIANNYFPDIKEGR